MTSLYTYDENVFAAAKAAEYRRNTKSIIVALIIIVVIVLIAIGIYWLVRLRTQNNTQNNAASGKACSTNLDCNNLTPVCKTGTGICVECGSDSQCSDPTPVCKVDTGNCVACTDSVLHCSGATPTCDPITNLCQ